MEKISVMRFEREKWKEVPVLELAEGDQVYCQGVLVELAAAPLVVDGKVNLSVRARPDNEAPITLSVGDEWREREATTAVMDYTNAACMDFGDGTYMIAELEYGPGAIYSPRLPAGELEAWCKENLQRYKAFFAANERALDRGDVVTLHPWWGD